MDDPGLRPKHDLSRPYRMKARTAIQSIMKISPEISWTEGTHRSGFVGRDAQYSVN